MVNIEDGDWTGRDRRGNNGDIMDKGKVIITGASSGIGAAIANRMAEAGYEVYGIGRDFEKADNYEKSPEWKQSCDEGLAEGKPEAEAAENFHKIRLNLLDTEALKRTISGINRDEDVFILVNNAGIGCYGLHEQLTTEDIQDMVRTNLEVPMVLSNLLVKTLKKNRGFIINISSHTATQANPHGCAYGATKAALSSFSRSLFEEERKYGLKVVTIEPDMTDTNLYRNSNFGVDEDAMAYLKPEEVAEEVMHVISMRDGCVVTNIAMRPQINRIGRK